MLTPAEFNTLIVALGEPVTLTQAKPPRSTHALKAIVQDLGKAPEAIVNAYGLNGRSIMFAATGLPFPPDRFDSITRSNGEKFVLDLVNIELSRVSGAVSYYVAYAKGAA